MTCVWIIIRDIFLGNIFLFFFPKTMKLTIILREYFWRKGVEIEYETSHIQMKYIKNNYYAVDLIIFKKYFLTSKL